VRPTLTCLEGVGMNRHSARLIRLAGGALVATAIAPWFGAGIASAAAVNPPPPPYTSSINPGNIPTTAGPFNNTDSCSTEFGEKADNQDGWLFVASPNDFVTFEAIFNNGTVTLSSQQDTSATQYFTKEFDHLAIITPAGWELENAYATESDDNANKDFITLSHTCAGTPGQPEPTPPSGTVSGDCEGVTVHLDGGTDGGSFSIDPAGTSDAINESVAGGATKDEQLNTDAAHPKVTLTIDGEVPGGTFTRPADCDQQQSVTDPAVSFANACKTGISVTLTNMKVDDTTTGDVTFTVVSPSGSSQHVNVRADQIVRLSFPVTEDTTGTVTVSAPGLSETSHSFKKNCTTVLGEKVVKTPKTPKPPAVQGEQAQLPLTGMPAGLATMVAGLMLAVGVGLSVLGRRPTEGSAG
jgi:hypothetical protein